MLILCDILYTYTRCLSMVYLCTVGRAFLVHFTISQSVYEYYDDVENSVE